MKNDHLPILTVAVGLGTLLVSGCYKPDKPVAAYLASTAVAAVTAQGQTMNELSMVNAQTPTYSKSDEIPGRWIDIKDYTYDKRSQFFDGLAQLKAKVDIQVNELKAKRAAMDGKADTKEWDFAMKEMDAARTYLSAMGEELKKATPETWEQAKAKVGEAWVRTQDAYSKVKSSTTL